jgi:HSP20 family protein
MLLVKRNQSAMPSILSEFFNNDFLERVEKSASNIMPKANIKELEKEYVIELAVPGYSKKDFELNVEDDTLKISAQKEVKKEETRPEHGRREDGDKLIHSEYYIDSFERSFTLSKNVDVDKIGAAYKDGILTVTIPKKEEVLLKKMIKIK